MTPVSELVKSKSKTDTGGSEPPSPDGRRRSSKVSETVRAFLSGSGSKSRPPSSSP